MEEKITLLTEEQVEKKGKLKYINSRYLSVFKKCGLSAKPTDFDIMQGGGGLPDVEEPYWLKGSDGFRGFFAYGSGSGLSTITISNGIRPVLPLSKIYQYEKNLNISKINGIEEIEYGEYPQSIVNERLEDELELLYQQDRLSKTEKKYTLMSENGEKKYQEYKYYGNKYIRVYNDFSRSGEFSNGRKVEEKTYWVKVEPIKWLVNRSLFEENNVVVVKKILVSMPFSYSDNSNYEESDIKKFIEKYFVKDIVPSKLILTREEERIMKQKELLDERFEKSQSVYDAMMEREKEAIEGAILDRESVEFLNNNREEYGINTSINVKVRNGENIEGMVLFPKLSSDDNLKNDEYMEFVNFVNKKDFSTEDVENILNIMKEKDKENNTKHR